MRRTIVFVHHGMGIGGAPICMANVIAALDKRDFRPIVVSRDSEANQLFVDSGAELVCVDRIPSFQHTTAGSSSVWLPMFWCQLLYGRWVKQKWGKLFQRFSPEIIYLNSVTLIPLLEPAKRSGAKVVVAVRETVVRGAFGLRLAWMRRQLNQYADGVQHISEYDRTLLDLKVPHTEVIRDWVDFETFDWRLSGQSIRSELGLNRNQRVVTTLGGETPIKGTATFLRAANALANRTDVVFIVVGMRKLPAKRNGKRFPSIKSIAKRVLRKDSRDRLYEFHARAKLKDKVFFLGPRRDIANVLAATDVLVFPAIRPHQALPVHEAGAMQKPVVVSNFDCLKESVVNGVTGLVFPPRDAAALATVIERIITDSNLMQSMGRENFARAREFHSKRRNAALVVDLFQRIANIEEFRKPELNRKNRPIHDRC